MSFVNVISWIAAYLLSRPQEISRSEDDRETRQTNTRKSQESASAKKNSNSQTTQIMFGLQQIILFLQGIMFLHLWTHLLSEDVGLLHRHRVQWHITHQFRLLSARLDLVILHPRKPNLAFKQHQTSAHPPPHHDASMVRMPAMGPVRSMLWVHLGVFNR